MQNKNKEEPAAEAAPAKAAEGEAKPAAPAKAEEGKEGEAKPAVPFKEKEEVEEEKKAAEEKAKVEKKAAKEAEKAKKEEEKTEKTAAITPMQKTLKAARIARKAAFETVVDQESTEADNMAEWKKRSDEADAAALKSRVTHVGNYDYQRRGTAP